MYKSKNEILFQLLYCCSDNKIQYLIVLIKIKKLIFCNLYKLIDLT